MDAMEKLDQGIVEDAMCEARSYGTLDADYAAYLYAKRTGQLKQVRVGHKAICPKELADSVLDYIESNY